MEALYDTNPIILSAVWLLLLASTVLFLRKTTRGPYNEKGDDDGPGLPPHGPDFKGYFTVHARAKNQVATIEKYGDIFTIPSPIPGVVPDQVVINDIALVKELTIKQANMYRDPSRFTTRGDVFATATRSVVGVGVTGLKGDEWHWRKKALLKEFHRSKLLDINRGLLEVLLQEGASLCQDLQQASDSQVPVEVDRLTTKAAVSVILFALFGRVPDFDTEEMRESAKILMECLLQTVFTPMYGILKYIPTTKPYKMEKGKIHAWKVIDQVVATEIQALLDEHDGKRPVHPDRKPNSIIASLLVNEPRFREGGVKSMIAEGRVFVQAGFETTAHSLAFAMGMMAERPDLADEMAKQAKAVLGYNQDDKDFTYSVENTRQALEQVTLVKNFFLESLRLYPLAPVLGGECTQDVTITTSQNQTYKLPKGTATSFLNLALQRQIPDPEVIQPSAWDVPPSQQPFLNTFQNGPHSCPGKPLSLLEGQVFLMLAALNFEFSFPEGLGKVEYEENLLLRPKDGMPLFVKRRTNVLT